jgi:acyl-CoA synthetase (AMP-forming)/AMP-acid ligase II
METNLKSFQSIWQKWMHNANTIPNNDAIVHWRAGEEPIRITFSQLLKRANEYSVMLKEHGVKQGEVCAIIIRHNAEFYPIYLGVVGLRAIPAVLAYPNPRLHPDKFRQGLEGMSQRSGLDWILSERELDPIIHPLVAKEGSTIKGIQFPLEWTVNDESLKIETELLNQLRSEIKREDPFLLQHSSGTTGLQKPVLLSNGAVLDHVENMALAMRMRDDDKVVSWLPLYHDMGLIGAFHFPIAFGITTIQIDPFEWVLAPAIMFDALTKEKATLAWLPNFAYNLMADKIPDHELEDVCFESMRMIINASEPIRDESHKRFFEKFSKYSLKERVLSTMYGMAETTLVVTQTEPGLDPKKVSVDRDAMANGFVKIADDNTKVVRVCVSSGKPIRGCELKIVDENRYEVEKGRSGEIAVKSVSMFDGYRNYPEKTAEVVDGKWYFTGDYGFEIDNEYYVIGRKKDIIIVAGKNIYPEDIEDAVGKVEGVIPGRAIALGEEDEELGTEDVSVIAETNHTDPAERRKLRFEIIKAGMEIDISIFNVYLVPPRWLIKSSAGKPSRKHNRERISDINEKRKWVVR